jgi:hypothetical protein
MRQLLTIFVLLLGMATCSRAAALGNARAPRESKPLVVKVLALNFDPLIPQEGNRRLHVVCGWHDPRQLAEGYMADVKEASGGFLQYRVVEWKDIDTFHTKVDGFTYTPEQYMECRRTGKGWHQPDTADYPKTFKDYNVLPRIDRGEIDEVWFFGGPYFGYNESAMAGPGAFYINGVVYDKVPSKRAFAIMGYNYERGNTHGMSRKRAAARRACPCGSTERRSPRRSSTQRRQPSGRISHSVRA